MQTKPTQFRHSNRLRVGLPALLVGVALCGARFAAGGPEAGGFPLRINDVSGLDAPWPLIGGVPFPEGAISDPARIRVVDGDGAEVPAQVDVAATWRDGSIRWAQVGLNANPQGDYRVEFGPDVRRAPPATPLAVRTATDGGLSIDTGAAVYDFLSDRLLPETARMGETVFLANAGAGAYLIDNQGRLARVAGPRAEIETRILKQGPVRTVIRRDGWYVTPEGEQVARARVFFYFTAGSPYARITHSLIFTEDTNELWVRDYGLAFATPAAPERAAFPLHATDRIFDPRHTEPMPDPKIVEAAIDGAEVYVIQDTYPNHKEHEDYRALVCRASEGGRQSAKGVFWHDEWLGVDDAAGDWGSGVFPGFQLTVATPHLAQRFPKEIAFGPRGARVALWSGRSGRELDFRTPTLMAEYWQESWTRHAPGGPETLAGLPSNAQGAARTHDVWLLPGRGVDSTETVLRRTAAVSHPPLLQADPVWLCAADAMGWPLHPMDTENFPAQEEMIRGTWDLQMNRYGFQRHAHGRNRPYVGGFIDWGKAATMRQWGDSWFRIHTGTMDYNMGFHVWGLYARSGERDYFNYGSWINQFGADMNIAHWTAGDKFKGGFADGYPGRANVPLFWGTRSEADAKVHIHAYLDEYYLSGNEHLKAVVDSVGEALRERWDPADIPHRIARVDMASYALVGLGALYKMDRDPFFKQAAMDFAGHLVDPESPTGMTDKKVYGTLYKADRDSRYLALHYRMTGDERARDAVLKFLDYRLRFSSQGTPRSIVPPFAHDDYLGPLIYTFGWHWTGNPDYARVVRYLMDLGVNVYHEDWTSVSIHANHHTFLAPIGMTLLAELDTPPPPYPIADRIASPASTRLLFRKPEGGRPVHFRTSVFMRDAEQAPSVRVLPHPSTDPADALDGIELTFEQAFETRNPSRRDPELYYAEVTVPAAAPAGLYALEMPEASAFRVIDSDAPEVGLYAPEGLTGGRHMPTHYFRVPEDAETVDLVFRRPIELRRPDGTLAVPRNPDHLGLHRVPVEGASGFWSLSTHDGRDFGSKGVLSLLNLDPVFATAPELLPTGEGLGPAPRYVPPSATTDFVPAPEGRALHLPGEAELTFPRGAETQNGYEHFPRETGTLEFWFRPNWSADEIRYQIGGDYTDLHFLRAGAHTLQFRRGMHSARGGHRMGTEVGLSLVNFWLSQRGLPASHWFQIGEWVHLAVTWRVSDADDGNGNEAVLYLDGKRAPVPRFAHGMVRTLPTGPFTPGAIDEVIRIGPFNGAIARLRISDTVRYDADFEPTWSLPEPDGHTRVQFALDGDNRGVTATGATVTLEP